VDCSVAPDGDDAASKAGRAEGARSGMSSILRAEADASKAAREESAGEESAEKVMALAEYAAAIHDQARQSGLRFEAYLPPALADWLLARIESGVFTDPAEAVFVLLTESRELEPHTDLRGELLRRSLQAAADDPRPAIPHEVVEAWLNHLMEAPRPEPAVWKKEDG
jgi:antitoxin ParD1/3/4